jgi:TolB protein
MKRASFAIFLAFAAATAHAQVTVQKPAIPLRAFAVGGFAGTDVATAAGVTEILRNDLRLSGYFQLVPAANAEFVQQGELRVERGNVIINIRVTQLPQKSVLSKQYTGSAQDLRRVVHKISDDIVEAITGNRGIAQTKIAFVWSRNGVKELAVMDYDGHNVRQFTYDKSISVRPRWSPNGRQIVYTSYKNGFPDVLLVDLFTGHRRRLASFSGLNTGATFSPRGDEIALTLSKDGNPELYVMNVPSGSLRRLTHTRGAESSPTWSPDGEQIAYVSDDAGTPQIYMISRAGGEAMRLTVSPAYNTEPDWSRPNNQVIQPMIAVTSRVGGRFQVGLYDSATRSVRPVVADDADNMDPSWAPNGRHLVFTKIRNFRSRLYLLDVVTGDQVELPAIQGDASEAAWSP